MIAWMGIGLRCFDMLGNYIAFHFLFNCPFRRQHAKKGALMGGSIYCCASCNFPK